jgi:hypothetical protein
MVWNVTEITLQLHYVGAASDTLRLACRSVSELPAEYYPDQTCADGLVVRSVKEPRSLMVRGIGPEELNALDALNWNPYELSFTDRRTGTPVNFCGISRRYTREPGAARFALGD